MYQKLQSWCTVPYIRILEKKNEKNVWRYYHFPHVHHEWQSYDVWFLRYGACRTEFFVILDCFCTSTTPKSWNIKILKNWKTLGDIIVLHMCTIDNNHMIYGSWDIELTDFFVIFLPFASLSMVYTFESQGRGRQKNDRKTSGYSLLSRGTVFFSTPALVSALKEFFVTKCFKTLLLLVILLW